jgi:hypothetical protein
MQSPRQGAGGHINHEWSVVALEDRKRHRDIVPVPVIESKDRMAARLVISGQPLKALLEANYRPSFSL